MLSHLLCSEPKLTYVLTIDIYIDINGGFCSSIVYGKCGLAQVLPNYIDTGALICLEVTNLLLYAGCISLYQAEI